MAKATPRNVASDSDIPVDLDDGPYESGTVIADKYELLSVIGEGGMGSVWRARNKLLHVEVAIKLIHSELASDEADQRLLTEARSAAQLRHPAIVSVHDFGITDHGDPYIVMELLEGESLGEVVDRRGSLSAVKGVQMLLPIVGALSTAHAKGIVHRDIKPDNVILVTDESGRVVPKIVDFGIAKVEQPAPLAGTYGAGPASRPGKRLTQVGHLVGSPGYMSPEQASGSRDVDERADLWGLCVVLYETVVGEPPFETPDLEETLIRILVEAPTPCTDLGVGDEALWKILERGLTKDREERWQTADDLGRAMAQWLIDQGMETDIAGTSVRQHWLQDAEDYRPLSDLPPASSSGESLPRAQRESSGQRERPREAAPSATIGGASLDEDLSALVSEPPSRSGRWVMLVALAAVVAGGLIFLTATPEIPGAESAPASSPSATTTVETASEASPEPTDSDDGAPAASTEASPEASGEASAEATATAPPRRYWPPRRPAPSPKSSKPEPAEDEPKATVKPPPPPPPAPKPAPKGLDLPEVPNF